MALVALSGAAAGWALNAHSVRDPYAYVLPPHHEAWRDDAALHHALASLKPQDRNLLRLWIAQHHAGPSGRSRTIREAIAELKARARNEPALRAAVALYTEEKPSLTSVSVDALAGSATP